MIIELFGPPGVGKTTFAAALTLFLRERGHVMDPIMSYRPAEQAPDFPVRDRRQAIASVWRLTRPVTEMMTTAGHLLHHSQDAAMVAGLMRLLPPKGLIWPVRLRQYLFRLSHSWHLASSSRDIVLFDQAFIQAVCSLALLGRAPDPARMALALDAIPAADLLIRLDAPRDILAGRLGERQHRQGRIERLFELDLQTNLASIGIIDDLYRLLRARSRPVTSVDSFDQQTLQAGVARAGAEILATLEARRPAQFIPDRSIVKQAHDA